MINEDMDDLVFYDYRIDGITINWKKANELWLKYQLECQRIDDKKRKTQ